MPPSAAIYFAQISQISNFLQKLEKHARCPKKSGAMSELLGDCEEDSDIDNLVDSKKEPDWDLLEEQANEDNGGDDEVRSNI